MSENRSRDGQYLFIGVIVKVFVVPNGLGYTIVNTLTYFVPMPMVQEFLPVFGHLHL